MGGAVFPGIPPSRQVIAGAGATGGGPLTADVTINAPNAGALANIAYPTGFSVGINNLSFSGGIVGTVPGVGSVDIFAPFDASPTIPKLANFTLDNAGTASIQQSTNGIRITAPALGAFSLKGLRFNAGVADFTNFNIITRARRLTPMANSWSSGLYLRNSVSTKIVSFTDWDVGAEFRIDNMTDFTGAPTNIKDFTYYASDFYWRRIQVTGGNINFLISPDGVNWWQFFTQTLAAFIISVNQVGMCVNPSGGVDADTIFHSFTAV